MRLPRVWRFFPLLVVMAASCTQAGQVEVTTTLGAVTQPPTTTTVAAATTSTTLPTTTTDQPATTTTQPTTTTTVVEAGVQGTGQELFTFNGWGTRLDENSCPADPVESYPSATTQMLADFLYEGMTDGQDVYYEWTLDDRQLLFTELTEWAFGPEGDCLWFELTDPGGLPDGTYALSVFAGAGPEGRPIGNAATSVGEVAPQQIAEGIAFEGRIVDLDTGLGIPGAMFCILEVPEGMTPDEAIENFFTVRDMNLVAAFTSTDAEGFYQLGGLPRADQYPLVVEAIDYEIVTGTLELLPDDPEAGTIELEDIAMVRR
jgi:hypothetical protein